MSRLAYSQLKDKLHKLQEERKEYLAIKSGEVAKMLRKDNDSEKLIDELKEIDRQVEGLGHIISTSVNIAISIISPVQWREKCLTNIRKTVDLLDIELEIKSLLENIMHEKKIENKIKIILQANTLIKHNSTVFEMYRELFLKESLDVLNHLQNAFNEMTNRVTRNMTTGANIKECHNIITELDKNSILTYKLSNDISHMMKFFSFLTEFIITSTCPAPRMAELSEIVKKLPTANNSIKQNENIKLALDTAKGYIQKIFLKVAKYINERLQPYLKEFSEIECRIVALLIEKLICGIENIIEPLLKLVLEISEFALKTNDKDNIDCLCGEESLILGSFEKFKFFIVVLVEKINKLGQMSNDDYKKEISIFDFLKKFNTLLYDLGEKYANNEIKFMKMRLLSLFKEESKAYQGTLEKHINSRFDELSSVSLTCVDDTFYILKMSGLRSISTMNLQMSLAIVNNIKVILLEDLYDLLDTKISAILIKTENINSSLKKESSTAEVKYTCKEEPVLSYKFTYGNLFLISCINSIDQTKSNISLLMEELKNQIDQEIVNSEAFNHRKIIIGLNDPEEQNLNNEISYIKKNELELVSLTFSDVDSIINKYDEFLNRKIKYAFDFLYGNINSSVDILNSINFFIDEKNILNAEIAESFSGKFIEETDKILKQWKMQLSESGYAKFIGLYVDYVVTYIEKLLKMKTYSTYGVIILEKDMNKIANYFQSGIGISIRDKFNRLFSITKVLNFESREELIEHVRKYDDIKLSKNEIEHIRKLKKND